MIVWCMRPDDARVVKTSIVLGAALLCMACSDMTFRVVDAETRAPLGHVKVEHSWYDAAWKGEWLETDDAGVVRIAHAGW